MNAGESQLSSKSLDQACSCILHLSFGHSFFSVSTGMSSIHVNMEDVRGASSKIQRRMLALPGGGRLTVASVSGRVATDIGPVPSPGSGRSSFILTRGYIIILTFVFSLQNLSVN